MSKCRKRSRSCSTRLDYLNYLYHDICDIHFENHPNIDIKLGGAEGDMDMFMSKFEQGRSPAFINNLYLTIVLVDVDRYDDIDNGVTQRKQNHFDYLSQNILGKINRPENILRGKSVALTVEIGIMEYEHHKDFWQDKDGGIIIHQFLDRLCNIFTIKSIKLSRKPKQRIHF